MVGTIPRYLKWYNNWVAEIGANYKIAQDIPRGSLCMDVGANIGITALTFAVQRPDCHVIAFEPVPDNVECLRRNAAANDIRNVEIIPAAVGNSRGTVRMTNDGPWSSVYDSPDAIEVPVVPLDDHRSRLASYVKIDVEGYEPQVLDGARKLFTISQPLVMMEFNTWYLLLHHVDVISFSQAIWDSSEVLGLYCDENFYPPPANSQMIVHENVVNHKSVTDIAFRSVRPLPSLDEMILSPESLKAKMALHGMRPPDRRP